MRILHHCLFAACVALVWTTGAAAMEVPLNDGFVTVVLPPDKQELVLPQAAEQELEQILSEYRQQTSNEIAILIVDSLDDSIAEAAVEVGRKWGVGTAENDNGILILMSYSDQEIFIATGYGLEGAVPDIVAKGIIEEDVVPAFREGKYPEGFRAAIESLKKHIGGEYTAERYASPPDAGIPFDVLVFIGFIVLQILGGFLGRTKSWWLGGVFGVVGGIVLTLAFGWWLSIPILTILGFAFDYLVSKLYPIAKKRSGRRRGGGGFGGFGGGSFGGGSSSSGGFGGFSGGSFGGGGAGGRW